MENTILDQWAKRLNLTPSEEEQEKYILTDEEEKEAIAFTIKSVREHKYWKFSQMGLNEYQIQTKLDSINWDEEINKADILSRANSSKNYDLWVKEKRENEKQDAIAKRLALVQRCNAKYMFNVMSWTSEKVYGKKLIVHDDNRQLIKTLCFFLSNDERFEKELGLSLNKGLLIRGISGLGKTYLLQCLQGNELLPIGIISMLHITDQIKNEGEYPLEIGANGIVYLDDVGTEEPIVNHFGTKISFFKNFIELFYLNSRRYNRLIISTNNTFLEIEQKYGFRVRSRLKDMFNIIDVKGTDMRG